MADEPIEQIIEEFIKKNEQTEHYKDHSKKIFIDNLRNLQNMDIDETEKKKLLDLLRETYNRSKKTEQDYRRGLEASTKLHDDTLKMCDYMKKILEGAEKMRDTFADITPTLEQAAEINNNTAQRLRKIAKDMKDDVYQKILQEIKSDCEYKH